MKTKDKIEELFQNQTYILEAVKNLNERLTSIEERLDDQRMLEVKEILESQAIIEEIIVKNTDDIVLMKKMKQDNNDSIMTLELKINLLEKEIQKRNKVLENNYDKQNEEVKEMQKKLILCRFTIEGFVKNKVCAHSCIHRIGNCVFNRLFFQTSQKLQILDKRLLF